MRFGRSMPSCLPVMRITRTSPLCRSQLSSQLRWFRLLVLARLILIATLRFPRFSDARLTWCLARFVWVGRCFWWRLKCRLGVHGKNGSAAASSITREIGNRFDQFRSALDAITEPKLPDIFRSLLESLISSACSVKVLFAGFSPSRSSRVASPLCVCECSN